MSNSTLNNYLFKSICDNHYCLTNNKENNRIELKSTENKSFQISIKTISNNNYIAVGLISNRIKNKFARMQLHDGSTAIVNINSIAKQLNISKEEVQRYAQNGQALWAYILEQADKVVNNAKMINAEIDSERIKKCKLFGKNRELAMGLQNKIDLVKDYMSSYPNCFNTLNHCITVGKQTTHFKTFIDENGINKIQIRLGIIGQGIEKQAILNYELNTANSHEKFRVDYEQHNNPITLARSINTFNPEVEKLKIFSNREGLPKVWWINHAEEGSKPIMKLYYSDLGKLQKELEGPLSMEVSLEITRQLIAGLKHVHEKRYTHNDLRLCNMLINDKFNDPSAVKVVLCDFGMSKKIDDTTNMGSVEKDIRALGKALYLLLNGKHYDAGNNIDMDDISHAMPLNALLLQMIEQPHIGLVAFEAMLRDSESDESYQEDDFVRVS